MTLYQTVGPLRPHHPPAHTRTRARLGLVTAVAFSLSILAGSPAAAQDAATPPASPAATPAPDAPRITIEFEELNDSGVSGEAVLSEFGDRTIVELELEDTGENHPAHIHEGTCDDIQPEAAHNLENVGEEGTSSTVVDATLDDLIDGDFVIDLHLAPNQLGTLIACAEIEGTPEVPPTGGEGTPTAEATEEATEEATTAAATEEAATEEATAEPTQTPTPEPTAVPTKEPTVEPTEATDDGTGGVAATTTPTDGTGADRTTSGVSDPTASGKGVAVGDSSVGDGTSGESNALSGKGDPVGGTDELPQTTGSGTSLFSPQGSNALAIQGLAAFAVILALAGIVIRRGEHARAASTRFRRLGL